MDSETSSWKGRVAIVTGGSSGIGRAVAEAIASGGGRVVVTGRDRKRLDGLHTFGGAIAPVQADSADPGSAARIVAAAIERWGRLDLLVNNAGAGRPLPIEAYDAKSVAEVCAVNLVAPSLLVKEARAALRASRGAIVNVGTALSRGAAPGLAHYAATKAALEHLTRSWAVELAAEGIRVNAVSPGPVKTGALTGMMGLSEEEARVVEEKEAAEIPLGSRGRTDDVVPWILRLGHPENEWITGQVLTVDGGWTLRR